MKIRSMLIIAAMLIAGSIRADIITILFDLNNAANVAVPPNVPSHGGTWNVLPDATDTSEQSGFLTSTGATSDVTVTLSGSWSNSSTVQTGWNSGNPKAWVDSAAVADYFLIAANTNGYITFGNLDTETTYVVAVVHASAGSNRWLYPTVNGVKGYDYDDVIDPEIAEEQKTGFRSLNCWNAQTIMYWKPMAPDVDGRLRFEGNTSGGNGYVTAIMLQAIPEPGSVALLALGGSLALRRRRRRRLPRA